MPDPSTDQNQPDGADQAVTLDTSTAQPPPPPSGTAVAVEPPPPPSGTAVPATLAQRIRAKYPDSYNDLDDATLEDKVLAKHPEYSDLPRSSTKAGFDVAGARKAGYSDDEILQHLTASQGRSGFDVDGATKAGYSKAEIIDHLAAMPATKQSPPSVPDPKKVVGQMMDDDQNKASLAGVPGGSTNVVPASNTALGVAGTAIGVAGAATGASEALPFISGGVKAVSAWATKNPVQAYLVYKALEAAIPGFKKMVGAGKALSGE